MLLILVRYLRCRLLGSHFGGWKLRIHDQSINQSINQSCLVVLCLPWFCLWVVFIRLKSGCHKWYNAAMSKLDFIFFHVLFCFRWYARIIFPASFVRGKCCNLSMGNLFSCFASLLYELSKFAFDICITLLMYQPIFSRQVVVELDRANNAGSESDLGQCKPF